MVVSFIGGPLILMYLINFCMALFNQKNLEIEGEVDREVKQKILDQEQR